MVTPPTPPTPQTSQGAVHSANNPLSNQARPAPPRYTPNPNPPTTQRPPAYTPTSGWTIGSISDYTVAGRNQSIYDRLISQNIGRTISAGHNPQIVLQAQQMFSMRSSRPPPYTYTQPGSGQRGGSSRPVEVGGSAQTGLLQWRNRPGGPPRYGRRPGTASQQVEAQSQARVATTTGNFGQVNVGPQGHHAGEGSPEEAEVVEREESS